MGIKLHKLEEIGTLHLWPKCEMQSAIKARRGR